jgi:hypothetical protein
MPQDRTVRKILQKEPEHKLTPEEETLVEKYIQDLIENLKKEGEKK